MPGIGLVISKIACEILEILEPQNDFALQKNIAACQVISFHSVRSYTG